MLIEEQLKSEGGKFMEESLGSVKAAIDLFKGKVPEGNSVLKQSSVMKSLEKPYPRTSQLHMARRDIGRLGESRKVAESEKAKAESELSAAKKMVDELSSRIKELNSRLNVRNQDLEKLKTAKRGGNWGMAQNTQHSKVITELGYAKEQLSKLKQDTASILEEKRRAEREIETSGLKMQSFSSKVEALRKEVEELNEELVLVELARIEAIKEFREIEAQRREDAEKHLAAMEETRKKINGMVQEIESSKELQEKLDSVTTDVHVLQSELKQVKEMERRVQPNDSMRCEPDYLDKDLILLHSLKEDLKNANKELASIKRNSFEFMASMDIARNELKRITDESARLKKKGNKADLAIQNLNAKLLRAKAKLEAAEENEGQASSIASSLSLTLEQLRNEMEAAEKERAIAIEEAAKVKEQIQKTESEDVLAEERWEAAIQELETIKSSEATLLNNLKRLVDTTMTRREAVSKGSTTITISRFEYEYLTGRAAQAGEIADKKIAAAQAWIKALRESEKEISMKTELIRTEIQELKMEEVQEALKTEQSLSAMTMVNMELQKWEEDINEKQSQSSSEKKTAYSREKMTPSRRAKFRKSGSSAPRTSRVASFAVRRRRKVMPNIAKLFNGKSNDENL